MTIYLCEDSFEGILSGVYDAWMSRLGHKNVRLELADCWEQEMFVQCRDVLPDPEKGQKVAEAIRKKISGQAYRWVYRAAMSGDPGKADKIYRFLIYGFHLGSEVTASLGIPQVHEVFRLNRAVAGEVHLLEEFIRFSQYGEPDGERVLFSVIGPKYDVAALLMPHFCDRLRGERFVIYDEKRRKAAVHVKGQDWYLVTGREAEELGELAGRTDAGQYANLWRAFFGSIAIRERENYVCQRGHLPLRYRYYMTEFQGRS